MGTPPPPDGVNPPGTTPTQLPPEQRELLDGLFTSPSILFVIAFVLAAVLGTNVPAGAGELILFEDHLYRLAAFTESERGDVLAAMRRTNPQLVITDLTRDANSVKIYFGSKGYLEILRSELYSLASFVPQGIEAQITRRSRGELLVGRIRKTGEGIRIYLGDAG